MKVPIHQTDSLNKKQMFSADQNTKCVETQTLDLSIIIPVRDEEGNIAELVSRLSNVIKELKLTYEIIFITDNNRDNTFSVLQLMHKKDERVKILKLANSFGQHIAVMAGLHFCHGDMVVIMDGDLQDHPEDIPKLYNKLKEGYDVAYGIKERKNDSLLRNFLSGSFVKLLNMVSDYKLDYNTNMFRIMSRRIVREICNFKESKPSLTGLISLTGFPTAKVMVTTGKRKSGKTKYNFLGLINLAITFLLSFSSKPIRIISIFGFLVSGFSFMFLVSVIVQTFLTDEAIIMGYPTIASLITLFSGVQLLAIGIIGEYIGYIFLETKNRPLYILEERIGDFDSVDIGLSET